MTTSAEFIAPCNTPAGCPKREQFDAIINQFGLNDQGCEGIINHARNTNLELTEACGFIAFRATLDAVTEGRK